MNLPPRRRTPADPPRSPSVDPGSTPSMRIVDAKKRRMHNLDLHGWGIVTGLKPLVVQTADGDCLEFSAGHAIDPEGNDIVVPEGSRSEVVPDTTDGTFNVFLVYKETADAASKRQAYNSPDRKEARTVETFQIVFHDKEIRNGVEIGRIRVSDGK